MTNLLSNSVAQGVILVAIALILGVVAYYLLGKLRGDSDQTELTPSELLSNFREMHAGGELSDEEYRTIKTKLAAQLQAELKDTDEPG